QLTSMKYGSPPSPRRDSDVPPPPYPTARHARAAAACLLSRAARQSGDGRLHLLAGLGRERRRRRLLHELLMPALDRAFALAEREDVPVPVAQDLDLDVAGRVDDLLEVEGTVAERRFGLGGRSRERLVEAVWIADEPHTLPTPARGRLEQDREADRLRRLPD